MQNGAFFLLSSFFLSFIFLFFFFFGVRRGAVVYNIAIWVGSIKIWGNMWDESLQSRSKDHSMVAMCWLFRKQRLLFGSQPKCKCRAQRFSHSLKTEPFLLPRSFQHGLISETRKVSLTWSTISLATGDWHFASRSTSGRPYSCALGNVNC